MPYVTPGCGCVPYNNTQYKHTPWGGLLNPILSQAWAVHTPKNGEKWCLRKDFVETFPLTRFHDALPAIEKTSYLYQHYCQYYS